MHLFCVLVVGLSGCNGNDPEQNGSNGTNGGGGQTENLGGATKLDKFSGCLNGGFSVAKGKYVRFSMGNLQYTQSTQTWSFAKNQYDMIGMDNVTGGTMGSGRYGYYKSGEALADKIDLFGWSGSTATAKWGISISEDYNDYSGDFKDWGQNAICNGGNKANQWRTLTYEEWEYLIWSRANASSLQGVASVNGVNGLILLSDGWKQPNGVSFKSGFDWSVDYADCQTFTLDQWSKLESAGAVFLPASATRYGTDVYHVGYSGRYWSATPGGEYGAWDLYFISYEAYMGRNYRYYGQAVRLVQDVQ